MFGRAAGASMIGSGAYDDLVDVSGDAILGRRNDLSGRRQSHAEADNRPDERGPDSLFGVIDFTSIHANN